jgi:hypothetical protein
VPPALPRPVDLCRAALEAVALAILSVPVIVYLAVSGGSGYQR